MLGYINNITKTQDYNIEFKGLNKTSYVAEGEFQDMLNITSDNYPALSPSPKKIDIGNTAPLYEITGMVSKDGYIYATAGTFLYVIEDGEIVKSYDIGLEDGEKQLVCNATYIIIWPDQIVFNTKEKTWEKIGNSRLEGAGNEANAIYIRRTNKYGGVFENELDPIEELREKTYRLKTTPSSPADGEYWYDRSAKPATLHKWSEQQQMWADVALDYITIYQESDSSGEIEEYIYNTGDSIYLTMNGTSMSSIEYGSGNSLGIMEMTVGKDIEQNSFVISTFKDKKVGDKYITGMILGGVATCELGDIAPCKIYKCDIERKVPDMDFICEMGNRIWGCSSEQHEIYASMLGTPTSWYKYEGISDDSYAATIGTDGQFTGIAADNSIVYFFKEECVHYVAGSKPANFTISTIKLDGIEKGSHKSAKYLNGYFYYKARRGVMCFNGSSAMDISKKIQVDDYTNGIAGVYKDKYYISLEKDGISELFVLDTAKSMWHKEETENCKTLLEHAGNLYLCTENTIKIINSNWYEDVEWYCVTGDIDASTHIKKYLSKIMARIQLESNAKIRFDIMFDSDGVWYKAYECRGLRRKQSLSIPIMARRCDHFKIKISGQGLFKLYSLTKVIEGGSE